jgi:hypothetical protein
MSGLAILFWFYKEPDVCENRLDLLRRHNAGLKIFGLFGGEPRDADGFHARLGSWLDDFYAAPAATREWKWLNGDLMLLDWFQQRGQALAWDQVAVVQWDLLVLSSLRDQLPGMEAGQLCLAGVARLDDPGEQSWFWTRPDGGQRPHYLRFREHVRMTYGYDRPVLYSGLIFQVLPRAFFERYAGVPDKEIGMLEYKMPTYAEILGIPFYERDFGMEVAMNAIPREIPDDLIRGELRKPDGWRLFHPYYKVWDTGAR